jgi:hypothetical protein
MSSSNEGISKLRIVKLKISQKSNEVVKQQSPPPYQSPPHNLVELDTDLVDLNSPMESMNWNFKQMEEPRDMTELRQENSTLPLEFQNFRNPLSPFNSKTSSPHNSRPNSPHNSRPSSPFTTSPRRRAKSPGRNKKPESVISEGSVDSKKRTSEGVIDESKTPSRKRLSLPSLQQQQCSNCSESGETCLEGSNDSCYRCILFGLSCNRFKQEKHKSMGFYEPILRNFELTDFDIDLLETLDLLDLNEEYKMLDSSNSTLDTNSVEQPVNTFVQEEEVPKKKNKWNQFDEYLSNELKNIATTLNLKKEPKEKKEIAKLESLINKQKQQILELRASNSNKKLSNLQTKSQYSSSTPFSISYEKSSLPMMFVSTDGQLLSINKACGDLFQFSPQIISHQVVSLKNLVNKEDFDQFLSGYISCLQKGEKKFKLSMKSFGKNLLFNFELMYKENSTFPVVCFAIIS